MKRSTMNMTLAVAGLLLAAGTASAQAMNADIPFAFRVGTRVMQPGDYQVRVISNNSGVPMVRIANFDSKQSALVVPLTHANTPKAWLASGAPTMRFACGDGICSLDSLWTGDARQTMQFRTGRGKNGEPQMAEVKLRLERAGD